MIPVDLVILKATSNSNKKKYLRMKLKKINKTDKKKNSRFSSNLKLNYIKNVLI